MFKQEPKISQGQGLGMEKMDPIHTQMNCTRDYYTYQVDWPLELNSEGRNFLNVYFGLTKKLISSGKRICRTGPFFGEGNYFEFVLAPGPCYGYNQTDDFEVYLKCCHPNNSSLKESYNIISASLSAAGSKDGTVLHLGNFGRIPTYSLPTGAREKGRINVHAMKLDVKGMPKTCFVDSPTSRITLTTQSKTWTIAVFKSSVLRSDCVERNNTVDGESDGVKRKK